MESQLRDAFHAENIDLRGAKHNDTIIEAAHLCRRHGIKPAELVLKWLTHHHNSGMAREELPTRATLAELGKKLERAESKAKKGQVHYATADDRKFDKASAGAMFDVGFMDAFGVEGAVAAPEAVTKRTQFTTPARRPRNRGTASGGPSTVSPTSSTTSSAPASSNSRDYNSRTNSGKVELTYNPEDRPTTILGMQRPTELDVGVYPNCVDKPYRHMFQKLRDVSDILDARIDDLGDRIVKKHALLTPKPTKEGPESAAPELGHVALPNQETVPIVARVCLDTQGEGRLNAASVVFEGSRDTSNGERVEVNLAEMQDFSLFPGQVIAAEGTNTTGTRFTPSSLYLGAPLPLPRSDTRALVDYYFAEGGDTEVVDILVAAGPFTTTADMTYAPLDDLLDVIRREKPDAVVLIGPFVDEEHPAVKKLELDVSHDDQFEEVINRIGAVVIEETESTELLLVPSLRDVHHDKVYPQPPYQLPEKMEHDRLHCLANPSTFTVKEMVIGVNTADILMDLSKQETSRGQSGDRMGRLANHLLLQRSYYPLCPPAPGLNLVFDQLDKLAMPLSPDIMLLPSDLRFFAKNVSGTMVVNPGRLSKFSAGGTYAKLAVHAPRRNDIPEEARKIQHSVQSRTVVQVVRV